jgi:LacI family transcriptional regulator
MSAASASAASSRPKPKRPTSRARHSNRVSMQEVAERAGVALSSVSRVISGHPDVSPRMRDRVLSVVADLGYEPDILAQSLRRGRSMTVGFVVGNISNPLLAEIALGAETQLRAAGYTMLLANSMEDPELDREHIRVFRQRRVDGLLLSLTDDRAPEPAAELARVAVPAVLVDRDPSRYPGAATALHDHATGIERAAEALLNLGHRRIALVNGPPSSRPARERAAAFRRVLRRRRDASGTVCSGPFSPEHGLEAMLALMEEGSGAPTAVIAGSNQILVGVLRALKAARLKVPADLSVVTCDDQPLSELFDPPLATISRNPRELGEVAATLLLEQLQGQPARSVVLPTTFRLTESCAPPPGQAAHGRTPRRRASGPAAKPER